MLSVSVNGITVTIAFLVCNGRKSRMVFGTMLIMMGNDLRILIRAFHRFICDDRERRSDNYEYLKEKSICGYVVLDLG